MLLFYNMSFSAASAMMTAFGLYHEEETDGSFVEAERMTHMLPLLEGAHGETAENAVENNAVLAVVNSLREDGGGPDSVEVRTIRWRGQTKAAIQAQLQPIVLHYRLQILLVRERTHRRALEMAETNARVPLVTEYYQKTPVKWRLVGYMGSTQALHMPADSESLCRTPGSTVTSVSEAKREQQFRESFMRMEETVLRRGSISSGSTPMNCIQDGHRSLSARSSRHLFAFSPVPIAPKGMQSGSDTLDEREEALNSTVAFVDPTRHKK